MNKQMYIKDFSSSKNRHHKNNNNTQKNEEEEEVVCYQFRKKPFPKAIYLQSNDGKWKKIRVCQDCGSLETCHGPNSSSLWRHIFIE